MINWKNPQLNQNDVIDSVTESMVSHSPKQNFSFIESLDEIEPSSVNFKESSDLQVNENLILKKKLELQFEEFSQKNQFSQNQLKRLTDDLAVKDSEIEKFKLKNQEFKSLIIEFNKFVELSKSEKAQLRNEYLKALKINEDHIKKISQEVVESHQELKRERAHFEQKLSGIENISKNNLKTIQELEIDRNHLKSVLNENQNTINQLNEKLQLATNIENRLKQNLNDQELTFRQELNLELNRNKLIKDQFAQVLESHKLNQVEIENLRREVPKLKRQLLSLEQERFLIEKELLKRNQVLELENSSEVNLKAEITQLTKDKEQLQITLNQSLNSEMEKYTKLEFELNNKVENFKLEKEKWESQEQLLKKEVERLVEVAAGTSVINDLNKEISGLRREVEVKTEKLALNIKDFGGLQDHFDQLQKTYEELKNNYEIQLKQREVQFKQQNNLELNLKAKTQLIEDLKEEKSNILAIKNYLQEDSKFMEEKLNLLDLKYQSDLNIQSEEMKLRVSERDQMNIQLNSLKIQFEKLTLVHQDLIDSVNLIKQDYDKQLECKEDEKQELSSTINSLMLEREFLENIIKSKEIRTEHIEEDLKRRNQIIETQETRLRSYSQSINRNKSELLNQSKFLLNEYHIAEIHHPLKDYLEFTETELSKVEFQLKRTPTISIDRNRLEESLRQLIEQRDLLKKIVYERKGDLALRQKSLVELIESTKLAPIPPPPPKSVLK